MFLRRLDDQTTSNTQEAMDRLTVPRQEATMVKKEGKRRIISFYKIVMQIFNIVFLIYIFTLLHSFILLYLSHIVLLYFKSQYSDKNVTFINILSCIKFFLCFL